MTAKNTRETFDRALREVLDDILLLGSMVEGAIIESVESLRQRDFDASRKLYHADQIINQSHFELEEKCIILIATQQPIAKDLRLLAS